nr:hypothetical protein [Pandoravirus massiliensis]
MIWAKRQHAGSNPRALAQLFIVERTSLFFFLVAHAPRTRTSPHTAPLQSAGHRLFFLLPVGDHAKKESKKKQKRKTTHERAGAVVPASKKVDPSFGVQKKKEKIIKKCSPLVFVGGQ